MRDESEDCAVSEITVGAPDYECPECKATLPATVASAVAPDEPQGHRSGPYAEVAGRKWLNSMREWAQLKNSPWFPSIYVDSPSLESATGATTAIDHQQSENALYGELDTTGAGELVPWTDAHITFNPAVPEFKPSFVQATMNTAPNISTEALPATLAAPATRPLPPHDRQHTDYIPKVHPQDVRYKEQREREIQQQRSELPARPPQGQPFQPYQFPSRRVNLPYGGLSRAPTPLPPRPMDQPTNSNLPLRPPFAPYMPTCPQHAAPASYYPPIGRTAYAVPQAPAALMPPTQPRSHAQGFAAHAPRHSPRQPRDVDPTQPQGKGQHYRVLADNTGDGQKQGQ
ncbi:hypothetical protein LTS18_002523 [Coniosporium uncinatum]|uniref:Uncharacterized protein n=1 Tax=Coniosporium uncinatum TaxID=93489 RepID=A0ACC3DUH2_9PEZI|nr:hypothetical protein LTS18_002523 [Coniosporium uncinatum]